MGYESSENRQASRRYQRLKERNTSAASTVSKESNFSYGDDFVPRIARQTELTGVMIDDREKLIKSLQHDNTIFPQYPIQVKEDKSTNWRASVASETLTGVTQLKIGDVCLFIYL